MNNSAETVGRWSLSVVIALTLLLLPASDDVQAQWPPFKFDLTPTLDGNRITYRLELYKLDASLTDVTIKIPLPAGTRFVEAFPEPMTTVEFDGAEVTFVSAVLHRSLKNTSFVVELVDPRQTIVTTQAWIAWQDTPPGTYLAETVTLDTTRRPLSWTKPYSRLRLEIGASVTGGVITYSIYPRNVGPRRMWDVDVKLPLPVGTTFISATAPPFFSTHFDGQTVSFLALELAQDAEIEPLQVKVATDEMTTPVVTTYAWASWKNVHKRTVKRLLPLQEETRTADLTIQPNLYRAITGDMAGDTPFPMYDLTGIAFHETETQLGVTFHTAAPVPRPDVPLQYLLYIDADCRLHTGADRKGYGVEMMIKYSHATQRADLSVWNETTGKWEQRQQIAFEPPAEGAGLTMWLPINQVGTKSQFCWVGRTRYQTDLFHPKPADDWLSQDVRLMESVLSGLAQNTRLGSKI